MTLIITRRGFWQQSPFSQRAKEVVESGITVGTVHTDRSLKLECNGCGSNTTVVVEERQGRWGFGKCAVCGKPYLLDFI